MTDNELREQVASQLHDWYLMATVKTKEVNPKAQISYEQLTEEQKDIDRFIAEKVLAREKAAKREVLERVWQSASDYDDECKFCERVKDCLSELESKLDKDNE